MYDAMGNGLAVGQVLQGFGLHNAGRYYTVEKIGRTGRVKLHRHLDGRRFWQTNMTHYRVVEG